MISQERPLYPEKREMCRYRETEVKGGTDREKQRGRKKNKQSNKGDMKEADML